MATSILGTFPILNFKKSQTDEYGFDYVSYQYTIKTSDLALYNIKKDDVFTGIESWTGTSFAKGLTSPTSVTYVVDSIGTNNTPGGLTELTINTVGSKNSPAANPPRIVLLSGGPLIFGLSGTAPPASGGGLLSIPSTFGYGVAGVGQSVEVKFLANGGALGQQQVFTTYFSSLMPATFQGISLPVAAQKPKTISSEQNLGGGTITGSCQYYGFVCKTILTEKRGSLLLVTLTFSEAGIATRQIRTATSLTGSDYYRFPIIG